MRKDTVTLDVPLEGKSEAVNFSNVFYTFKLEYNLFFIGIITKAGYLILSKKKKMTIFNSKENITFEAIRIGTSYLIDIPASKKILALLSILPLKKVELE